MNMYFRIFLSFLMISTLWACTKDQVEAPLNVKNHLTLHPVKKAYYNADNNRFEIGVFNANENALNYTMQTTSGNKYRVLMYGIPMSDVTIELHDFLGNIIKVGEQANVGLTAKYFVFDAVANSQYFIHLETTNTALFDQSFYLTFEEVGTYNLSWKGINWQCDGDWEVNSNDQLIHIGHNSGFSKWMKITDQSYIDCAISMEFNTPITGLPNYLGFSVDSGDELFDMLNLPSVGRQFKITGLNAWNYRVINIGNNGGIGNLGGYLSQPLHSGLNLLDCTVHSDSIRYFVNGIQELSVFNDLYGSHRVYLTVEDIGSDTLVINDFVIN